LPATVAVDRGPDGKDRGGWKRETEGRVWIPSPKSEA
jgi:hypothetical protein